MKFSEKIYKGRGIILGIFAISLLLLPPNQSTISVSAFILLICGICLRIAARRNMGIHSRSSTIEAPKLVQEGMYKKIRHPLYLSNGFIASGFLLLHLGWQTITFPIAAILWLFLFFLAHNEDLFLHQKFGSVWENWAKQTPFMFPSLKGIRNLNFERGIFEAFSEDFWTWFFLILYLALIFVRRIFF